MAYDDFIEDLTQCPDIYQKKIRLLQRSDYSSLKGWLCLSCILLLLVLIPAIHKLNCCLPQDLIATLVILWLCSAFSLDDDAFRHHPAVFWLIIFFTFGIGDILSPLIFCKDMLPFIPPRRWLRRGYRRLHQATEPILSLSA